jgi:hypothetical protein
MNLECTLPHPHPKVLHYKTPDIGRFFYLLTGGLTGTVAGLCFYADQHRRRTAVSFLQPGRKLKGMGGHNSIVMIGGSNECGRIRYAIF